MCLPAGCIFTALQVPSTLVQLKSRQPAGSLSLRVCRATACADLLHSKRMLCSCICHKTSTITLWTGKEHCNPGSLKTERHAEATSACHGHLPTMATCAARFKAAPGRLSAVCDEQSECCTLKHHAGTHAGLQAARKANMAAEQSCPKQATRTAAGSSSAFAVSPS